MSFCPQGAVEEFPTEARTLPTQRGRTLGRDHGPGSLAFSVTNQHLAL
jgi:hypothetical protein